MNREIKFRAWDKENHEMIYSDVENYVVCVENVDYDDSFGLPCTDVNILEEVMQYTGLKDKNGKEIYEGDIIKTYTNGYIQKIEFDEDLCGFVCRQNGLDRPQLLSISDEVIGNVYENPELLEVKNE